MIIFAENFRGFKNISVDISKNLFVVGDNSSGKSSILHLIDYVCSSDLFGMPQLDDNFNVHKFDFFSPYFDYADVTIGFMIYINDESVVRIITIKKVKESGGVFVSRCSFFSSKIGIIITRYHDDNYEASFYPEKNINLSEVVDLHHRADSGFSIIEDVSGAGHLNDQSVIISALMNLFDKLKGGQRLVFAPVPLSRHIGPMRAKPESFYPFDRRIKATGDHFATMMRDLSRRRGSQGAINKFGKESGLFERFSVKPVAKNVENAPLMAIVRKGGKDFLLSQVGFGVSQVAPILVETQAMLLDLIDKKPILLEQPELHLHPVAQAALGEYIFEASTSNINFIIETHSEYLIDRFRARIKETRGRSSADIIYCYNDRYGNRSDEIGIGSDGRLIGAPDRYYEFFLREISRTIL